MATWQINTARNQFSDVLDQAESEGPQVITRHGKERAVILSIEDYRSLKANENPDFITFLLSEPKFDLEDFEIERDRSVDDREIEL